PIEVLRVGSEAEGFLRKTVVLLVHQRAMRVGVNRMTRSVFLRLTEPIGSRACNSPAITIVSPCRTRATVSASRTLMIGTATPELDVATPVSCVTFGLTLK